MVHALKKWSQVILNKLPQHKYAINAKLLGDDSECAWTNLGYWDDASSSYSFACQQLAEHLAQAVQLQPKDRVLDLGCGQGASLKYWLEHYKIHDLEAVELQQNCVNKIQKYLQLNAIHCQSFLDLSQIPFNNRFDVVMCIDAAYHSDLNLFLNSANFVLNHNGRLGFHYLMLSDQVLSSKQKIKYIGLLKAADVTFKHLKKQEHIQQLIQQQGFDTVQIHDISEQVLLGFSDYISKQLLHVQQRGMDHFKIQMTAKLCRTLFKDGVIKYVQISAQKK